MSRDSRQCCIMKCESTLQHNKSKFTLFKFPDDEEYRRQWLKAVKHNVPQGKAFHKRLYICHLHFHQNCFENNDVTVMKDGALQIFSRKRKRLKTKSVPSIFPLRYSQSRMILTHVNGSSNTHTANTVNASDSPAVTLPPLTETLPPLTATPPIDVSTDIKIEIKTEELIDSSITDTDTSSTSTTNVCGIDTTPMSSTTSDSKICTVQRLSLALDQLKAIETNHLLTTSSIISSQKVPSQNGTLHDISNTASQTLTHVQSTSYSIGELIRDWNAMPTENYPSNWCMIETKLGAIFLYYGDTFHSVTRSIHVKHDMTMQLQAYEHPAGYPFSEKVSGFKDLLTALLTVSCLELCKGTDERSYCPDGFFVKKPHSGSDLCKKCQLKRRRERDLLQKKNVRWRNKIVRDKKFLNNIKQKYKRCREKMVFVEQVLKDIESSIEVEG